MSETLTLTSLVAEPLTLDLETFLFSLAYLSRKPRKAACAAEPKIIVNLYEWGKLYN